MESLKRLLILVFLCLSSFSFSQTWFQSDDVWHYSLNGFAAFFGYEQIQYNRDTIIDGKACKIIFKDRSFWNGFDPDAGITQVILEEIVYEHGDTLSLLVGDTFYPLYNFGMEVGDTLSFPMLNYDDSFCNLDEGIENQHVLVENGVMEIEGQQLRYQKFNVFTPWFEEKLKMLVVEKMGVINYEVPGWTPPSPGHGAYFFYPKNYQFVCYLDAPEYGFRCFSNTDVFYKTGDVACDFMVLNNEDINSLKSQVQLFPNPVNDQLEITMETNEELKSISLFTIDGKIVKIYSGNPATTLHLQDLKAGTYFVQFHFLNQQIIYERFIKQ